MTPDQSSLTRVQIVTLAAVLAVGTALRVVAVDRLPGINGDEAWYGVNVQSMLEGSPPFWHTGIGNPLNPFHSVPLFLLVAANRVPSLLLLRVPELVWGLLALFVAFPLLRKPLGTRAALLSSSMLAVSPAAVAYSRFGWDPSGTPLVSLLALGLALRDRPVLAGLCSVAGLIVHPTNVFLAPIIVAAWAPHAMRRYVATDSVERRRLHMILGAVVAALIAAAALVLVRAARNPNTSLPSVAMAIERMTSPSIWGHMLTGVLNLFSGASTIIHISTPLSPVTIAVGAGLTTAALVLPAAFGWRTLRGSAGVWLLSGLVASFGIFSVVAGPSGVDPTHERYAMFFLVPLIVFCAIGLDALAGRVPAIGLAAAALTLGCLTVSVGAGYFAPLVRTGGDSGLAFRTGAIEPKAAAYAYVLNDSRNADVVSVVAQDWWLYWPLRYLAWGERDRIHVEMVPGADAPGGLRAAGASAPSYRHAPDKSYAVVFDFGPAWPALEDEGRTAAFTAFDPSGRPILHVVPLPPRLP